MHSLLQIFPLICSIWCCWKTTLLLPISTFCILPFKVRVLPRICPCSSMQVFWHIFLTFCWDRLFLSFEDVNLEYQTSFLDYSFLHDLIPWNFFFQTKPWRGHRFLSWSPELWPFFLRCFWLSGSQTSSSHGHYSQCFSVKWVRMLPLNISRNLLDCLCLVVLSLQHWSSWSAPWGLEYPNMKLLLVVFGRPHLLVPADQIV